MVGSPLFPERLSMDIAPQRAVEIERRRAILALVVTAAAWSTSGLLIKLVPLNAMAIAGGRSLIAALVLLVYLRRPRITFSLSQIVASLAYAATMITFVLANKLTTPANAIFLQYLSPAFVAVLGIWFLGERPRPVEWIIIAVVIAGMGLFFIDRLSFRGFVGNIVAIVSGLFFALFIVFMRKQHEGSPLESMLLGHLITALVSIPFWIGSPLPDAAGWGALLALGVFQIGLSSISFAFAVKHVTALGTAIITLIEPVLNPVWVFVFSGERPTLAALAGGLVILSMVTLRSVLTLRAVRPRGKGTPDERRKQDGNHKQDGKRALRT